MWAVGQGVEAPSELKAQEACLTFEISWVVVVRGPKLFVPWLTTLGQGAIEVAPRQRGEIVKLPTQESR